VTERTNVTLPLSEYQRATSGAPTGVVAFIALGAFAAGLVVGMTTIDRPAADPRTPTRIELTSPASR